MKGPERGRLEGLVGSNVTFLPRVDEARLAALYAGCRALLHPGVDDFGMVMVEALAAGKPVIAYAEGGALDIVRDGETGVLVPAPTVEAVRAAIDRFERMSSTFEPALLQRFARRFDRTHFERRFSEAVDDARRARRDAPRHRHRNGVHHGHDRSETTTNGSMLLSSPVPVTPSPSTGGPSAKRLLDIALAASGLAVSAPLLAALAALIPFDSRGPALFFQRRTGLDQRPFTMIKLRTMDAQGRVTRLGRLLRPTGLDELPQLWNVLKGDMSLIGPRPEVPERAQHHALELPDFLARHQIRPGITGWAQVNGAARQRFHRRKVAASISVRRSGWHPRARRTHPRSHRHHRGKRHISRAPGLTLPPGRGAELREALRNVFIKGTSLGLERGGRFAVVVTSARVLGDAAFGRFVFASTITAIFALGTDLGLGVWTTRALARKPVDPASIVSVGLKVRAYATLPYALAVAAMASLAGRAELAVAVALLGIAALANAFADHFGAIFRGCEHFSDEARMNASRAVLTAVGGITSVVAGRSLVALCIGLASASLGGVAYGAILLRAERLPTRLVRSEAR